LSINSAALLSV